MPIYEYRCVSCEHTMEALQRMSDDPLKVCPSCGKETLSKMVSAASFRLKGGGWYETDFKTGKKKQLADSGSGPRRRFRLGVVDTRTKGRQLRIQQLCTSVSAKTLNRAARHGANSNPMARQYD